MSNPCIRNCALSQVPSVAQALLALVNGMARNSSQRRAELPGVSGRQEAFLAPKLRCYVERGCFTMRVTS